jgi:hypothetical protein
MRRAWLSLAASLALAALLAPAAAEAAAPTLGALSATDIQGESAVLVGTVDPEGLPAGYYFEYSAQPGFAGAARTSSFPAGEGVAPRAARAALEGLTPDTTYYVRLVANSSAGTTTGTAQSFTTTQGFGLLGGEAGFAAAVVANGGAPDTVPGSHPYQLSLSLALGESGEFEGQAGQGFPDGDLREMRIALPAGMVLNPAALPTCSLAAFRQPRSSPYEASRSGESCPDATQLGTVAVQSPLEGGRTRRFGLFNLAPAPGMAAQLGFAPYGAPIVLNESLAPNPDGSYALALQAANLPQALSLDALGLTLWGTPWAAAHNGERGDCLNEAEAAFPWAKCSVGASVDEPPQAYLTLPHQCSGPLPFEVTADSWQQPAQASATVLNRGEGGQPAEMGSCAAVPFAATPTAQLSDVKASSPAGFQLTLSVDQSGLTEPHRLAPAAIEAARIALPAGTTINPSVGAGLDVCSRAQFAAESADSAQGVGCPNASKLGDFTVRSPLFAESFEGSVYLAAPHENPFGTLIAVYLVARVPARGVVVKFAGRIDPAPGSGSLAASFEGLPDLPYSSLSFTLRTGERAPLVTPPACGEARSEVALTPRTGAATLTSSYATQISAGIGGGPCPSGPPPFAPSVVAGGINSNVNSYTPYFVHIARQDQEAEITRYSLTLPKGITGKLAGVPFCGEAEIEAARRSSGFAEAANPSCPAASEVGHTDSGYGVGSSLTYAKGRIYLAGPYHGEPLSLVAVNPATVGPFDLGTIVVRSAFSVDPRTAQLQIDSAASDPIPHILDGIPIHLRDLRIYMDRPAFTHNPSSCAASQLSSTLGGSGADFASPADDTSATSQVHFQLLNCLILGFKPKLGVRLRGPSRRGAYPELRATFAARGPQDSNLKEISVALPHAEFVAQNHIKGICSRAAFAADRCPADSVYGSAVAYTPLLEAPLRGDVYLRASQGKLPDLVASLHSGSIRIILEGAIGPTRQGGIKAYFAELPDEPIERFVMRLDGGRRGLLQNSYDICTAPPLAQVKALAQNNISAQFTTTLRGQCAKKKKAKAKGGKR